MIISDVDIEKAKLFIERLWELHPEYHAEITVVDENLHRLGKIDYIPCQLLVEISEDQRFDLLDEIEDMDIDYIQTDENPKASKAQKDAAWEKRNRYGIIEEILA